MNASGGVKLPSATEAIPTGLARLRPEQKSYIVSLFWFVRATEDAKAVNMGIKTFKGIPCYVNNKKVKKDAELLRLAPARPQALAPTKATGAPPTKRARVA